MATILSLDTSTKVCSVAIHKDGDLIGAQSYHLQKSHSSLLPVIIQQLMENVELELSSLDAIALSAGPGSYTGLRIGTATAKGLAYTLEIPLIAISSLDSMYEQVAPNLPDSAVLIPMIDARRMEVFCFAKRVNGQVIWDAKPLIVDESTFDDIEHQTSYFFGNGSDKFKELFPKVNFIPDIHPSAAHMGQLAHQKFTQQYFEDLAYFEPDYLKEYRTNVPSQKFKV
ncbi:tRNA (adenosine(37)-N6)-threonylcarbamoyltransferase complex dimerization subunit type 1 TsaB [Marinoscillum sp.]|uniref:tRNA (adenosine(37)-N6)-threonylcarbamoyltransferase complex dimerization subunit type 1 TsaB n=1 Tax=Marinoscillum sp. TaxID=2024838 RepID=UPI003BA8F671